MSAQPTTLADNPGKRPLSKIVESLSDHQGILEFIDLAEPLSDEALMGRDRHIEAITGDYQESEYENFTVVATPIALEAHFHLIDIQLLDAGTPPPFEISRDHDINFIGYEGFVVPDTIFYLSVDHVIESLVHCAKQAGLDASMVSTAWLIRAEKALREMPFLNEPQPLPSPGFSV